ncbi:MAG: GHKL domain-containing protein [Nitrospirae bacterium]|nr:GHKL domain-containing protein [Nitrospirota bacterium]
MLGTFTLRLVAPINVNNKLAGYIELGMDINNIVQRIKNTLEVEPYVLIEKSLLNQQDWESGMNMLGYKSDWNMLPKYVINNASIENIPECIIQIFSMNKFRKQEIYLNQSSKDNRFNIGYFPLFDASGKKVGIMVISDLYTHRIIDDIKTFSLAVVISLIIVLLILWFFYKVLSRIDARLSDQNIFLENTVKERTADLQKTKNELVSQHLLLEKTNEELVSFTYIVSHDLRAPLVNLTGFSKELNDSIIDMKSIIDESIKNNLISEKDIERLNYIMSQDIPESLNFITTSTIKINNMMEALLKLSRIGKTELIKEFLDVNEIVQFNIDLFAHQIETFDIKVTVGKLHRIYADRLSIEQIIGNLIDNAIKYRDSKRPLTLKISSNQNETETIFYFEDNGIGIDEDKTEKIFEVFHRIENRNVQGEGLGLANLKALVAKHGGHIWCESVKGVGSTFIFTIKGISTRALPLTRKEARPLDPLTLY